MSLKTTDFTTLKFPIRLIAIQSGQLFKDGATPQNYQKGQTVIFDSYNGMNQDNGRLLTRNGYGISGTQAKLSFDTTDLLSGTSHDKSSSEKQADNIVGGISIINQAIPRIKIFNPIGGILGALYAHKKGSSVGGYIGYILLFATIGSVIAIASVKISPPKQ